MCRILTLTKDEEVEYEDGGKFLSALLGAIGGFCGTAARILGIIAGVCTIAWVFLKG